MKKRILFIGFKGSSFCINDERILAKEYDVVPMYIPAIGRRILLRLPYAVFKKMLDCDLVYVWFGSVHAAIAVFIAKLLNRPSIVMAGGYDVANDPSIDYGLLNSRILRFAPIFAFNKCDKVMAVSDFTRTEALRIIRDGGKIEVVANGINTTSFRIMGGVERTTVTTVGDVNQRTFIVKGFNNFLEVVRRSPQQKFVLVGRIGPGVDVKPMDNLELMGYKTGDDLIRILNGSKYYLQLSYRESFGVAVIEAMACGCIPIVTDRGGLPEAVGNVGMVVEFGRWDSVIEAISEEYDPAKGIKARERVVELFDNNVREGAVLGIVSTLLAEAPSGKAKDD